MERAELHDIIDRVDACDARAVDARQVEALLTDLRRLQGWKDAAEARCTARLRELQAAGGGTPPADVHAKCGGVSAAEGRRKVRRSSTIEEAPSFGDALADGVIGAAHVDALSSVSAKLDEPVKAALLDCVDDLLSDATRMTPEQFARSTRELARRLERDNGTSRNRQQRRDTYLTRKLNASTGMIEGRFAFHPELAGQIFHAVDREIAAMIRAGERRRDPEFVERRFDRHRLAAEALGTLVAGGHQQRRPTEADITVIIDVDTLTTGELTDESISETTHGAPLPPASIRRLICQGKVSPVIVDISGTPINVGRTLRHANRAQRRALQALHRTCAIETCDVAFERCEMHHIHPWEHGGSTDLANLVPLCSRHHHVVHDESWQLILSIDRELTVRSRDGTELSRSRPDRPLRRPAA